MMGSGLLHFWENADGVSRLVAVVLLLMSVLTWVLILWKTRVLQRSRLDLERGLAALWAAPSLAVARERVAALDRECVLLPLIDAATSQDAQGTLAERAPRDAALTRQLRDALHASLRTLQWGQTLLASVGSTAPFVGLLGTVWGIYHALSQIGAGGGLSIERVAQPVGEALIMTAAGLAVAIPAVLAFNVFGRWLHVIESELEGCAHDLLEMMTPRNGASRTRDSRQRENGHDTAELRP